VPLYPSHLSTVEKATSVILIDQRSVGTNLLTMVPRPLNRLRVSLNPTQSVHSDADTVALEARWQYEAPSHCAWAP
jgi:hypothetical protein